MINGEIVSVEYCIFYVNFATQFIILSEEISSCFTKHDSVKVIVNLVHKRYFCYQNAIFSHNMKFVPENWMPWRGIYTTVASYWARWRLKSPASPVYSTFYSGADQRKHHSSDSLAFVCEFTCDRWIPRTNGQLRGKCFHLLTSSWFRQNVILCHGITPCTTWLNFTSQDWIWSHTI